MVQNVSKPLSFPTYRRSPFRSLTYLSLVRILSYRPPKPDNGSGRIMEQEKPEKGHDFSEFIGSTSMDPKDPVLNKITQELQETTEGVGDKSKETGTNDYGQELLYGQQLEKVDVSNKKKCSPGLEERKAKRKQEKQKNCAEVDRQLGVKRQKLPPVHKSKTIAYCRHYLVGRCHMGNKCRFSHDTVPLTKSAPCCHFARHSCMKGDDCPFDHELSKYPCNNFVTKGFCSRGDACLFSHQMSTMPSIVCRPELKSPPLSSRNTSFSVPPPNSCGNSIQHNHSIGSMGIHSHLNSKDKVIGTVQKKLTVPPKGISFLNIVKSSLPSPSTPKQALITPPNKESIAQIRACFEQSASGTH